MAERERERESERGARERKRERGREREARFFTKILYNAGPTIAHLLIIK